MEEITIVFVCVGNSCRSPMAEAIAGSLGGSRVDARSAGISPLGWISEQTLDALHFLGYPTAGLRSKGLEEVGLEDADVVLSLLGARGLDFIPRQIGARREAWDIIDPFGDDDEIYLSVARELEQRIKNLLEEELGSELPPV